MKLQTYLYIILALFLSACTNGDSTSDSGAGKPFAVDSLHKPYKYSTLHAASKGVGLTGKHAVGSKVGIMDFISGKIIDGTVSASTESVEDDFEGESITVTNLEKPLAQEAPFNEMLAILNYSNQSFSLIPSDTVRDAAMTDSLKNLVNNSGALKKLYQETSESHKFDRQAKRLFEFGKKKTPAIIRLKIPGLSAYLVSYRLDQKYLPEWDSSPVLIVINGKAYTASGPCGGVSAVYKLGDNYFINSEWNYCFTDVMWQVISEIRADGLREEAVF